MVDQQEENEMFASSAVHMEHTPTKAADDDDDDSDVCPPRNREEEGRNGTFLLNSTVRVAKVLLATSLMWSAVVTFRMSNEVTTTTSFSTDNLWTTKEHRQLSFLENTNNPEILEVPSDVSPFLEELAAREKLFADTPPEEVKYWFEYTGPLQKYFYRYSKSRGKADYFEGRDDSGVTSARFVELPGGGDDFREMETGRLVRQCRAMGASSVRADGRCRILFVSNMVGAGVGPIMLWETHPPNLEAAGPRPWMSEQASAATPLARNLQEIDHLCGTGAVTARVQVLVCEPVPGKWTDWMASLLPNCGGDALQVVVVASPETADKCHDTAGGYVEQRMQDLVLAPPADDDDKIFDPRVKTTHPDLASTDDHDLYVAFKWSSLVTTRAVSGYLQASADLAAAAKAAPSNPDATTSVEESTTVLGPQGPFPIPSFVRVSYVSEENNKVAKWRMHGDFFHPAAWEICKESYQMSWIPDSLATADGERPTTCSTDRQCGQWWVYFVEEQMSTVPEVFANEATPPLVRGGSNAIWMMTETQRQHVVSHRVCRQRSEKATTRHDDNPYPCGHEAHAVMPLGDLESFLINFMPNSALGKRHEESRRPGYSTGKDRKAAREAVRDRKQLKGQEDIERALFDYHIYPVALFHKDATLKAVRARAGGQPANQTVVRSDYYDVTVTKPRQPLPSWCQNLARRGLCALYSVRFRESADQRCHEACGLKRDWTLRNVTTTVKTK